MHARQDVSTGVNSGMEIMGITIFCLDLRPAPHKEIHVWYYKSAQKCMVWEIVNLR